MRKLLFDILFFFVALFPFFSKACDHDKLDYTIHKIPHPNPNAGRILATADRENIRIATFFFLDTAPAAISKILKEQIVPAAVSYYQSALKVDRLPLLQISSRVAQQCGGYTPPASLGEGIPYDVAIFVMGEVGEGGAASARPCVSMDPTDRPVLGLINYYYGTWLEAPDELQYEGTIYTTLHEIGHALGFTPGLFDNFIDPTTGLKLTNPVITKEINGVSTDILTIEPLRTRLRNYFSCPTLDGGYLENQGSPGSIGSHFERRIFLNEFMTASGAEDPRVTEFFLAVMEGTGWYTPDYSYAEPTFWGKGKGCDFLEKTCWDTTNNVPRFSDHYCPALTENDCTFIGHYQGFCGVDDFDSINTSLPSAFNYFGNYTKLIDTFADNCPFYYGYWNVDCRDSEFQYMALINGESFSPTSFCFTGTLGKTKVQSKRKMYCFKKYCEANSDGTYGLTVQVGNVNVSCTAEGTQSVSGYQGLLNCPDPNTFCSTKALKFCRRGCMGRGKCVNNQCVCNEGYNGTSCSYRTGLYAPEGQYYDLDEDNKFYFHWLAIPIGLGIILLTIFIGVIVNAVNAQKKKLSRRSGSGYSNPNVDNSNNGRQSSLFRYNSYASKKDFADLNSGAAPSASAAQIANLVSGDDSPYGPSYGETLRYQREQQANYNNQNNYNYAPNNYNQQNYNYNQNNYNNPNNWDQYGNYTGGTEAIRQQALRQNNVQTNTQANSGFLAAIRGVRQGPQS